MLHYINHLSGQQPSTPLKLYNTELEYSQQGMITSTDKTKNIQD